MPGKQTAFGQVGSVEASGRAGKRNGIAALFTVAAALGVRCGTVLHVIWNQERRSAGLDRQESHDVSSAVEVGIEGVKILIQRDRE
jgi:uridine phosphorylase